MLLISMCARGSEDYLKILGETEVEGVGGVAGVASGLPVVN